MGSWATTGIENDPGVSQLDVAGIFRLDHFPAKNSDIEILRFFLIPHGEEMRDEEAFFCNRSIRQIHAVPPVVDNRVNDVYLVRRPAFARRRTPKRARLSRSLGHV